MHTITKHCSRNLYVPAMRKVYTEVVCQSFGTKDVSGSTVTKHIVFSYVRRQLHMAIPQYATPCFLLSPAWMQGSLGQQNIPWTLGCRVNGHNERLGHAGPETQHYALVVHILKANDYAVC